MLYHVLFFFFKQKPAYEMRISDWSSDVCSSDLGIVNVGRAEGIVTVDGAPFALGAKDSLYVAMGAKEVRFSGDGARFYLASSPAHRAFDKIGRESCRERVCQYV